MSSKSSASRFDRGRRLSTLAPGTRGTVVGIGRDHQERSSRLAALGVTPGAAITVLQTFPGVVFLCDQTELAVEPAVARAIFVDVREAHDTVVVLEDLRGAD